MGWTSTQLTCVLCKNDQKLIKNKFWDVTLHRFSNYFCWIIFYTENSHMDHFTGQGKLF